MIRVIKRNSLASFFAPTLDRNRAFNYDLKTIEDFIKLVREVERKYNIRLCNKWNIDEKGVLLS